jgi:hypothetical protein
VRKLPKTVAEKHPEMVRRASAMGRENAPQRYAVLARRWPFGWVYYVVPEGSQQERSLRTWRQEHEAQAAMVRR